MYATQIYFFYFFLKQLTYFLSFPQIMTIKMEKTQKLLEQKT